MTFWVVIVLLACAIGAAVFAFWQAMVSLIPGARSDDGQS